MNDKSSLKSLTEFVRLLRRNGVPFQLFIVSLGCMITSMALEGISLGLVIPLLDTLVKKGDFGLLRQMPVLGSILAVFPDANFHAVFFALIGGILVATIAKNVFTYASQLIVATICVRSEHELRTMIFERYMQFSKSFIDRNKIGALCDLAFQQVILACDVFYNAHDFFLYALMSLAYLTVMMLVSWKLTLCSLFILPPIYLLIRRISESIQRACERRFALDQGMSATLNDTLSNMTLIHAYTNEAEEAAKYRKISDANRASRASIMKRYFFAPHAQDVLGTIGIAVLFALGLLVFKKGSIGELSLLMGFFLCLRRFAVSVTSCGTQFTAVAKAIVPVRQVLWVADDSDKTFVKDGTRPFAGLREGIEFRKVGFGYNGTPVLRDVDLVFRKGKMTALVGPTGAGKTTIVNLVQRFYDATSGQILVDGVPIQQLKLESLRSRIAVVDQGVSIFNATVRENIVYGMKRDVTDAELDKVAEQAVIGSLIKGLPAGYDTFVGDRGVRLSGGERQRIAIARAILKNPDIFIFDEATGSLDTETEQLIQKSIDLLSHDRTVIVIAHRLSTIRNADHIVVLEEGRVKEDGTLDELIARNGLFKRHWDLIKF